MTNTYPLATTFAPRPKSANPVGTFTAALGQMNRFIPSDSMESFLKDIDAAGLDSNGRPIGSTGGMVGLNDEQEKRLAMLRAPQAGQPNPGNPLAKLNETLGLRIGEPYEGSALRQATDALPAGQQIAGAIKEQSDQHKAAMFAKLMRESGGMPQPGQPDFATRSLAAEKAYDKIYGQKQPNAFLQPKPAYMGDNPGPTGAQVLAANGQELTGFGGTKISGTSGPDGNRFFLRQNPGTIPAANAFIPSPASTGGKDAGGTDLMPGMEMMRNGATVEQVRASGIFDRPASTPVQPVVAQSPFREAVGQYEKAVSAALSPREANKPEYRDGNVYDVKGRKALLKGGRFIDTETGAPLYSRNAFGEDVENPLVFGGSPTQAASGPAKQADAGFKKGQRVKQGGTAFEFDGTKMVPIGS